MYEIHIDRTKEPLSTKTFDGITSLMNYSIESFPTIHARELTNLGTISKLKPKNQQFMANIHNI